MQVRKMQVKKMQVRKMRVRKMQVKKMEVNKMQVISKKFNMSYTIWVYDMLEFRHEFDDFFVFFVFLLVFWGGF